MRSPGFTPAASAGEPGTVASAVSMFSTGSMPASRIFLFADEAGIERHGVILPGALEYELRLRAAGPRCGHCPSTTLFMISSKLATEGARRST